MEENKTQETIVLIKNDIYHRNNYTTFLRHNGYRVFCSEEHKTGAVYTENEQPIVVITDSLRYFGEIREKEISVPTLYITPVSSRKKYGLKYGAEKTLLEPFDFRELLEFVKKYSKIK